MTEIYPVGLAIDLELAKERFAAGMMGDELIGDIVRTGHRQDPSLFYDFPEFGIEPTLRTNDDGTVTAGVDIMHTRTLRDYPNTSTLRIAERLPLATLSQTGGGPVALTPRFTSALQRIGVDPTGTEPLETLRRWQENWQGLLQTVHGEVQVDPVSHGVELSRILDEEPAYFRSHCFRQTNLHPYDFVGLMKQYDWLTNVRVPEDMEEYEALRRSFIGLQAARGVHNVRYSLGAFDNSSGNITRVPGQIGLYARKGSVPDDSFTLFYKLTPLLLG